MGYVAFLNPFMASTTVGGEVVPGPQAMPIAALVPR
jgi:hypothetical protein